MFCVVVTGDVYDASESFLALNSIVEPKVLCFNLFVKKQYSLQVKFSSKSGTAQSFCQKAVQHNHFVKKQYSLTLLSKSSTAQYPLLDRHGAQAIMITFQSSNLS